MPSYPKVAQFKSVDQLRARLAELGLELPVDDKILTAEQGSPLARPLKVGSFEVGNRWCIHPMEGWDANPDGSPSAHTLRRWRHFGLSGAKLIWGGEAAAVIPEGRANPNQTLATPSNFDGLVALRQALLEAHRERFGNTDELWVGLQLTHSGRFCRPEGARLAPRIAYHHPLLDAKFGIDPNDSSLVMSDDELESVMDAYCEGAGLAYRAGFNFVDIKACHGYLLHEFLSARPRDGAFGGDFGGRTRALLTIVDRVRSEYPDLAVGVRLSVFDSVPYQTSHEVGQPWPHRVPYEFGFGVDERNPLKIDLAEPIALIEKLHALGVVAVNISAGSPYYNPHLQRPAIFPPSDGYLPPEDPLVGAWRQIDVARQCKRALPHVVMVGTGYSYLQDYLPHVAQAVVRSGWIDAVGVGRMVLAYPELPADCLESGRLARKKVCRTFSDCTTGPRMGLVSGCYPLDEYYKKLPEGEALRRLKQELESRE
jgi:2,4-dienoyl-CoA reductase-like NADH-dependent reductase (Old Yellow Enzyme family)